MGERGLLTLKHIVMRPQAVNDARLQEAPLAEGRGQVKAVLRVQLYIARHGIVYMVAKYALAGVDVSREDG